MKNQQTLRKIDLTATPSKAICAELEKLGRLPDDFAEEATLVSMLEHSSKKVQALAVKNLAKLSKVSLIDTYVDVINSNKASAVKREAAAAIGRLRSKKAVNTMLGLLDHEDPEIVLQAIRGLLVFKDKDDSISKALLPLTEHPNEIIRYVIDKEFSCEDIQPKPGHTLSPKYMHNVVVKGDVREVLKAVPDEAIHLTFTSPPYYNARDYSIYASYQEYLEFLEAVFQQVHRVTKEGRFFLLNTSPIIIPRVGRSYASKRYPIPYDIHPLLMKMGWEFIDDIVWVKPEASVKNRNAGFLQHRKPLSYKPNARTESIMVYRKKTNKLIDWNIRQYDSEAVNRSKVLGRYETSNVWYIDPVYDKKHSAVFPQELCNKVINYYSFVGDLVFDPFAGSGTFGKAAMELNRAFFLTEQMDEYVQVIKENLVTQTHLSAARPPRIVELKKFAAVAKAKQANER